MYTSIWSNDERARCAHIQKKAALDAHLSSLFVGVFNLAYSVLCRFTVRVNVQFYECAGEQIAQSICIIHQYTHAAKSICAHVTIVTNFR